MDLEKFSEQLDSELSEKKVPSKHPGLKGVSAKKRSETVKKAKKGEDVGKKGKKFKEIEASAAQKYGSKESGKRVAAAAMWKGIKARGRKG